MRNAAIGPGISAFCSTSGPVFLGRLLGLGTSERGPASVAAAAVGVLQGCRLLRVHDARGARHAGDLAAAVLRADTLAAPIDGG